MIAPFDSKSRIPSQLSAPYSQQLADSSHRVEKMGKTVKDWVGEHPTAAVVTCAVVGLLVGYLVKRR
jgi:ElaB/YqjD/DUF883 family membrane-anchored ribosome-binding protein